VRRILPRNKSCVHALPQNRAHGAAHVRPSPALVRSERILALVWSERMLDPAMRPPLKFARSHHRRPAAERKWRVSITRECVAGISLPGAAFGLDPNSVPHLGFGSVVSCLQDGGWSRGRWRSVRDSPICLFHGCVMGSFVNPYLHSLCLLCILMFTRKKKICVLFQLQKPYGWTAA